MFQSHDYEGALGDGDISIALESNCGSSSVAVPTLDDINTVNNKNLMSPNISNTSDERATKFTNLRNRKKLEIDTPRKRKRKFPGPAGLLPDDSHERSNSILDSNSITPSQIYSSLQNQIPVSVFEDGPWCTMLDDLNSNNHSPSKSTIAHIKNQYISHKYAGQRVPLLGGVIQNIDRTLQDPSITIRDQTGEIQGTLHHDAWEVYSCYLVPQYSVILLKNITLLTTGGMLKKIYLNITLNNIVAIYCDEDSSYTNKDKRKSISAIKENNENYVLDRVSWKSEEILVLRSSSNQKSTKTDAANSEVSAQQINSTRASLNQSLAMELLDGINTDALFDDFD